MMDVLDVARFFLSKSVPGTSEAITPLKLQKLIYYALAYYLAFDYDGRNHEQLLFDDTIEAWTHGPVCKKVYSVYSKGHNRFEELPAEAPLEAVDDNIKKLLDCVWVTYGKFSGSQLEEFTHMEAPWQNARRRAGDEVWERSNEPIDISDMRCFYKEKLELQ